MKRNSSEVDPGVSLRGKPGHREMFSKPLNAVIGQEGCDGRWRGPGDGGDTLIAGTPQELRRLQRADSAINF